MSTANVQPGGSGGYSKVEEEPVIDHAAFEALEREFAELLDSISGNEDLEKFRLEYEKLYRAFKTSFESEKRLVKRCKELNDIIYANTTKVRAAIAMTQEDSNTIHALKKEVDRAWQLVETAKDKEEKARKMIQELRAEITNLNQIVDEGSALTIENNSVADLIREREDLRKEIDVWKEKFTSLEATNESLTACLKNKESELFNEKSKYQTLSTEMQNVKDDLKMSDKKVKVAQGSLDTYNQQNKQLEHDLKERDKTLEDKETIIEKHETTINNLNENLRRLENGIKISVDKNADLTKEIKKQYEGLENLKEERYGLGKVIEERKKEIRDLSNKYDHAVTENKSLGNKIMKKTDEKSQIQEEKKLLVSSLGQLERQIDLLKKQADMDKHQIESLKIERDTMSKRIKDISSRTGEHVRNAVDLENQINSLERSKEADKKRINEQAEEKKKLEQDKQRYGQEFSQANSKFMQAMEEVKLKNNFISELQKKIIEAENRLKQQQNLYEAVRTDRNLYSKNLIEAHDEVAEIKRKFMIARHQISQLKDEMEVKEAAYLKESFDKNKINKNLENEKAKNEALDKKIKKLEEARQTDEANIAKLNFLLRQAEKERDAQRKEYDDVINERDIFGTQLIRRNDELALLYEKIKILQSTLTKGEMEYQKRLQDIEAKRHYIADLKRQLELTQKQAAKIDDLKKEVYHLGQQLLQERLQVKALSEELENPMNVHRWRKLEGTDPDTYEMVQKIQTLQKRLINKTEEVVERDVALQDKEKLILELKNILARQPGPEVAMQLSVYQQNLKEKTKQMKAMAAELNMYQAQVNEYKYEIERLTRELQDIKTKYYEQKRREQMQRESNKMMDGHQIKPSNPPMQRFTGGGFNLAV